MTVPTTDALSRIGGGSERGQGLALPVAKTLAHLMTVHNALTRDNWPMNALQARTEIGEAVSHLSTLSLNHALFTEDLKIELQSWTDNVTAHFRNYTVHDPDAEPAEQQRQDLAAIIRLTWSLLSLIDREITGLPAFMAEPGMAP